MIEHQQDKYSWVFMFLGANIDAVSEGASLGIKSGYSKTYTASSIGTQSVYGSASSVLSCARSYSDSLASEEFDTVVDLSKIEFKEFNLKSDDNGWFDFTLPMSKDEVKFKISPTSALAELEGHKTNENVDLLKILVAKELNEDDKLDIDYDINIQRDRPYIYEQYIYSRKNKFNF